MSSVYRFSDPDREPEIVEDLDEIDDIEDIEDIDDSLDPYTGKAAPTEIKPAAKKTEKVQKAEKKAQPEEVLTMASTTGERTEDPIDHEAKAAPLVEQPTAKAAPLDRGTVDIGLLLLRLVLGGVLIASGLATFFQFGGNAGLAGLEETLSDYNYPQILAVAVPTMELAAGVFLVLGLVTPIAAMVALAVTGFNAAHIVTNTDVSVWAPEAWLAFVLFGMALSVQFTGPGIFGVDFGRSWARRPVTSSWVCAAIGVIAAVLLWWFA